MLLLLAALACGGAEEQRPPSGRSLAAAPASERGAGRAPIVESVRLSPSNPLPGSALTASAEIANADGHALRVTYVWSVNGREVTRGARPTVSLPDLAKGDRVEVTVFASSGAADSDPRSASVGIVNRPPVLDGIQLEVAGEPIDSATRARPGDRLLATPLARDPDGDELHYSYAWFVNGSERGRERTFPTQGLRRGDRVHVRAVASDGEAESRTVESAQVVLGNTPPRITALPELETDEGVFRYTFDAVDDDGDRNLRFWLERAPDGMSIDPLLGIVTWRPIASQAGVHPVEVGVRDPHGDGSTFVFEVTVAAGAVAEPDAAGDEAPAALESP